MKFQRHSRRIVLVAAGLPLCLAECMGSADESKNLDCGGERVSAEKNTYSLPSEKNRSEKAEDVARAKKEAHELIGTFLDMGSSPREVASMADIRGVRLLQQRYLRQARIWLYWAVKVDAHYEPGLYNSARVAFALGEHNEFRILARALSMIDTPLAQRLSSLISLARKSTAQIGLLPTP